MQNNPDEREIARPNSWKTLEMPTEVASLSLKKNYTAEEFSLMARGFVPEVMEHKWFIFMQNNVLFFHRSWTGFCIYKVVFEQNNAAYVVQEALVNRDLKQYNSTDNSYDIALLSWLIDGFLLRKRVSFPVPNNLPKDAPPGLFQHHISGTVFPEVQSNNFKIMTNEQKAVLDLIRSKIELAETKNDGTKTAEMHMQFLINAETLQSLDLIEVISYIGLRDAFKTELSKMINLYKQLKLNEIRLIKTF